MAEIIKNDERKIALLIDCDNISARYVDRILSELSKYGKVTYKRMYGDWSRVDLKPWLKSSSKYSLTPVMQPNDTPGKNASDMGLIIDAMDILYSGEVEGFCIVSSDGDFNKLAKRIREAGKLVIGMGEKKTPESFRASCERFVFLDIILDDYDSENESSKSGNGKEQGGEDKSNHLTNKEEIEKQVIDMIFDSDDNEIDLAEIGNRLVKIYPDFDVRNYNYSKLSTFLESFDSLKIYKKYNSKYAAMKVSSSEKIKGYIQEIFHKNYTECMNVGELKKQLSMMDRNLEMSIRESGFTKFSTFLDKKIESVRVENNNAYLKSETVNPYSDGR